MKKPIKCIRCNGTGRITVMTGLRTDYCGVASEVCPICNGNGLDLADMTNADRIRAMSVEQLASLLVHNPACEEMDPYRDRCAVRNCRECLTEWLLRPAKEAKAWIELSFGSNA